MFKVTAYIDDLLVSVGTDHELWRAEEACKAQLFDGELPPYSAEQIERATFECEEV